MSTDFATKLHQFVCGLHGHDSLLHFERGRMSLKCVSCGHESPGWEIRKRARGDGAGVSAAHGVPARWRRLLPHAAGARRLA